MKVGIDISPLRTGHRARGIGFYVENLKRSLEELHSENEYIFFEKELDQKVDLIHYPYFDPFFSTLPLSLYKKVVTVHDLTPLVFPNEFPPGVRGKLSWYVQKLSLKRADAIIADSESSKKDIHKFTGIGLNKINVVYLAAGDNFKIIASKELKRKIATKYSLPDKFILYVGDATWNKNLVRLVRAVDKLGLTLVMAGKAIAEKNIDESSPWNKELVHVQSLTNDNNYYIKPGFVPDEDLALLYNMAAVFVMPSIYEGFGLPVLEAMQSGCPVVTTKEGSLKEVAGDSAHFVDPLDEDSIAKGIKEVFTNENLQEELRKKGISQAKKFSWEKTAKQTAEIYEKVFNK